MEENKSHDQNFTELMTTTWLKEALTGNLSIYSAHILESTNTCLNLGLDLEQAITYLQLDIADQTDAAIANVMYHLYQSFSEL